ncbi:MAG: nucleotidyltransferase domain-containing protein [Caldilineales bacterium]|nr:nucleotidyltransferase domain-containing protein [Caldilineales bacterium]
MNDLSHLPPAKKALLDDLVERLRPIEGVAAIVLGGSHASGTHHPASDIDVGLYYFEDEPFVIEDVKAVAAAISAQNSPVVTGFYEWGAWVNGGAWIQTPEGKVDFLYRNLDQVRRTIVEAQQGITRHDYGQQPTHGFYSVIYLAETQICIPLYDPAGLIAELKGLIETYPPRLKRKIIADSLWAAEFTLLFARDYAAQGDVYNTVGCLTRALGNMTQALFALNERYFTRDKKVMATMAAFSSLPPDYVLRVNRILACPGWDASELTDTVSALAQAWQDVVTLPGVQYEPQFSVSTHN